jgi:ribosomal protein S18 acetylase RimI-like enzyme
MIRKPLENEGFDCVKLLYQSGEHMFSYFLIDQPPKIYRTIEVFSSKPDTLFGLDNILVKVDGDVVCGMVISVTIQAMKQMEKNMEKYGFELLKTVGLFRVLKILFRSRLQKYFQAFQDETEYYIANIAVYEKHRGKGYGWELLEYVEAIARDKGFKKLSLAVEFYNVGAKRLYERFGFVEAKKVTFPKRYHRYGIDGFYKMVKMIPQSKPIKNA